MKTKIEIIFIRNIESYINFCMRLRNQGFWSFRGQRNKDWNLGPHIFDGKDKIEFDKLDDLRKEEKYLKQIKKNIEIFKRYFSESSELNQLQSNSSEWNWYFYAQHYGLKTNLLDWTSNPLVALYFAVENIMTPTEFQDKCGVVWALQVPERRFKTPDNSIHPENLDEWAIINPPPLSPLVPRLVRQSGKFTIHPYPININDSLKTSDKLIKIVLGDKENESFNPANIIRTQLGIMNIHHASLFPESENVTKYLNKQWKFISTNEMIGSINIDYLPSEKDFVSWTDLKIIKK
jgi:hypothetical protein